MWISTECNLICVKFTLHVISTTNSDLCCIAFVIKPKQKLQDTQITTLIRSQMIFQKQMFLKPLTKMLVIFLLLLLLLIRPENTETLYRFVIVWMANCADVPRTYSLIPRRLVTFVVTADFLQFQQYITYFNGGNYAILDFFNSTCNVMLFFWQCAEVLGERR